MLYLVTGLVLFLGVHSLSIFSESLRDRLVTRLGFWPFKGLYTMVALAGLTLIVIGYGQARMDPIYLYHLPSWLRHVGMGLMLVVFPALLAAYFPGRIHSMLKHPMLVAVKAWALAHLLVNGTLAGILLFGGFLAWAVADRISMKRRRQRSIPQFPHSVFNDWIVVAAGLLLMLAFVFWLHLLVIGVPAIR